MDRIISKHDMRILGLLTKGDMDLTQLASAIDVSKPMAQKVLGSLEKEGLVRSEIEKTKKGRRRVFGLAPFSLLLSHDPEKGGIISFRSKVPLDLELPLLGQVPQQDFRRALAIYIRAIEATIGTDTEIVVILFGSVARGEGTKKSDIDLLFISRAWNAREERRMRDILANITYKAIIQVKPVFRTDRYLSNKSDDLVDAIRKEGMVLFQRGGMNDIWRALERYGNISI